MATYGTLKALGMTDSEHRQQFYEAQDGRCAVCEEQLVYGHACVCDKVTKTFVCRPCHLIVVGIRKIRQPLWGKLLDMAGGKG